MLDLFRRKPARADAPPAPDARYRHAAQVTSTREAGRTVLLDHRGGAYFGLDEVGTRVWDLLGGGASLASAVDVLADEYDAPRNVLEHDVAEIVSRLVKSNLLEAA
ncbi:PqqD family protein [Longimicrobium sp.]|uniref:PqqD family protein n=1 Tax=Longimicrobium sp. TaxID=2029185 RepID=UPI002E2EB69E|nr:PqqD family protein [Longimicrobium sp.]HEX6041227.1 PqqD family protein [Longimicrobium sp.]